MTKHNLSTLDRDIGQPWSRIIQEAFKHGIDCEIIQGGLIAGKDEQSILEASTTQNYLLGTRRRTLDGRVFHYCKAGAALTRAAITIQGCVNDNKPYEGDRPATAYEEGKTEITIPATSPANGNAVSNPAKDAYAGGYIWFQVPPQIFHLIKSNTAEDGDGNQILTLDKPLLYALPKEEAVEGDGQMWITIWPSIYGNVHPSGGGMRSVVCKPLIPVAKGSYFWGQTWGPAFFQAGGTPPGITALYRTVVFQTDGSILDAGAAGVAVGHQRAGYVLSQTTSEDGDQLIMLQLAP